MDAVGPARVRRQPIKSGKSNSCNSKNVSFFVPRRANDDSSGAVRGYVHMMSELGGHMMSELGGHMMSEVCVNFIVQLSCPVWTRGGG